MWLRGYVDENLQARNILANPFGDAAEKQEYLDHLNNSNPELYLQIVLGGTENIANILRVTEG